jgi:L-ascorbate metabolism protein UlaG (beta-lactamase superfamily)
MKRPVLHQTAFLADVARTRASRDQFHLWWLGQSGFLVQWQGRHLLFDPYLSDSLTKKYAHTDKPHVRMTERLIAPERLDFIDVVTASHGHTDHLDPETLQPLAKANPQLQLVCPESIRGLARERSGLLEERIHGMNALNVGQASSLTGRDDRSRRSGWKPDRLSVAGFEFLAVPAAHENIETEARGRLLYLGYLVRCGPWMVYHSGDTVFYDGMVELLRPFRVDVALLPINGRAPERRVAGNLWGREAAWLAKEIDARCVIPCHYEMFEFNTASPDEFVAECRRLAQPYAVLRCGERWSSDRW